MKSIYWKGGRYQTEDGVNYDHIFTSADVKNSSVCSTAIVEVVNDEVVFEAVLSGNVNLNSYKAERHDIYQNAVEPEW